METCGFLVVFSGQTRLMTTWREAPLMISGTLTCLLPLPLLEGLPTVTTFCSLAVADNEWNGFLLTWSIQSLYYLRRMISQAYMTLRTSKVRKGNFTNCNLKYMWDTLMFIIRSFIFIEHSFCCITNQCSNRINFLGLKLFCHCHLSLSR